MSILLDGYNVIAIHWLPVSLFFLGTLGWGVWLVDPFAKKHTYSFLLTLLLACPIGMIPIALLTSFINLAGNSQTFIKVGSIFVLTVSILLLGLWVIIKRSLIIHSWCWWKTLLFVGLGFIYLVLRLSFLKELVFPPYSDSPFHVQLAESLMLPNGLMQQLGNNGFYHFGFHAMAAWMANLTGTPLTVILPLAGQCLVFLTALGIFAALLVLFNQPFIAASGTLLAISAWSMPAFAANWGKYPTLAAACLLPAIVSLVLLYKFSSQKNSTKILLLIFTAVISTLFHSRLLIVFILAGLAWLLLHLSDRLFTPKGKVVFHRIISVGFLIFLLLDHDLASIYLFDSIPAAAVILFGFIFIVWRADRMSGGWILYLILFGVTRYAHLPFHFPGGTDVLIDRPFTLVLFFLPLVVLVATGLQYFFVWISGSHVKKQAAQIGLILLLVPGILNASHYQPDDCCNWVRPADLQAFEWIKSHLPADATVYIPGSLERGDLTASDSAVWIHSQTGLSSEIHPYDYAWFSPEIYRQLCTQPLQYIYDSGLPMSFQIDGTSYPRWYQQVFSDGEVSVYQILVCQS